MYTEPVLITDFAIPNPKQPVSLAEDSAHSLLALYTLQRPYEPREYA